MKTLNIRVKQIRGGKNDNLQINLDYDYTPKHLFPVMLYTPDMRNTDVHYHIHLNKRQARALRDWLSIYVKKGE